MHKIGVVLAAALVLTLIGVSSADGNGKGHAGKGEVPFVLMLADCIDFDITNPCPPPDSDWDGWLDEEEAFFGSDPHDSASTPEYGLLDEQSGSDYCRDGIDNDKDGKRDLADKGCRTTCFDFTWIFDCIDWDGDGWKTYVEKLYGSNPYKGTSTPETFWLPATCNDGIDNDRDSLIDHADQDGCGIDGCIDFNNEADCTPF